MASNTVGFWHYAPEAEGSIALKHMRASPILFGLADQAQNRSRRLAAQVGPITCQMSSISTNIQVQKSSKSVIIASSGG